MIRELEMDLADKLVQHRKELGWTQAIAAKKISIQQSYLSKLESGQYIPSEEVINKICSAYKVKPGDLLPAPNKKSRSNYYLIMCGFIGIVLLLVGYLALVYPQTYYTYKAMQIAPPVSQAQANINYYVIDEYKGENYIKSFDESKYEYSLVAQRDVSRVENRWIIAVGLFLILITLSTSIYKYLAWRS